MVDEQAQVEELAKKLFEGLSHLLTMTAKTYDRDLHMDFLPYENFAEFYAERKSLFTPAVFTDPDERINRIAGVYVIEQLSHQLKQLKPGTAESHFGPLAKLDSEAFLVAVKQCFAYNKAEAVALLKNHWPAETEDIVRNNAVRLFG